jgi:uncharacterized membrane protein YgcG
VKPLYLYLLLLTSLLLPGLSCADERILHYQSNVMIHPDGELTVNENIRVRAEGREIRRGIYRDFPTRYKDRFGNHYRVDFRVDSVLRDGATESWHTEKRENGIRVYIGHAERMLNAGVHDYQIRFHTNRQLGFFAKHDELWWNVTGNGWRFPIDVASARIALPFDVPVADLELSAFVGVHGSTEASVHTAVIDGHTLEFETSRSLAPGEGFSVIAAWPKGLIAEPSRWRKMRWFARDNGAAIVLLSGLLLPLVWYYPAWNKVGRDPKKGVIIPRFKPPTGLSPAACRYVLDMSFDRNAFTAAIISLAIKGYIRIEEEGKEFTLHRIRYESRFPAPAYGGRRLRSTALDNARDPSGPASFARLPNQGRRVAFGSKNDQAHLTRGESAVLQVLLPHMPSSISMKDTNYRQFQQARNVLKQALVKEHLGRLFHLNTLYLAPPMVITVLAGVIALAFEGGPAIWVTWLLLALLVHGLFIWLLRAPTPAGRLVMDEIEGFKMYLNTAEQDRLDRMRSPALTPEVFESFLPYAYALGVENRWCERFARELPEEVRQRSGYQPGWYSGHYHGMHALNHLGDSFSSSFSSAISSASSPPGSSSGSGGGGSSGGGGGGGGGGGW